MIMSCWKLGVNTSEEMLLTASVSRILSALSSEILPQSNNLLFFVLIIVHFSGLSCTGSPKTLITS